MVRDIDLSKPLSEDDQAYLRERYSNEYVDRLVTVSGGEQADDPAADLSHASDSGTEAGDTGLGAGDPAATPPDGDDTAPAADADAQDDDLIGDAGDGDTVGNAVGTTYNPGDHTVAEVRSYMDRVGLEERNAIKQLEQEGRGRTTILDYDPS